MKTVIIDTNVFVSALISPHGVSAKFVNELSDGKYQLAFDSQILCEYLEVLSRKKFGFSREEIDEFQEIIESQEEIEGVVFDDFKLPDEDDRIFIEAALATRDKIIITGNTKHYPNPLMKKLGIKVLSPAEALKVL